MSQHDFDIANQTASLARADINLGLKALASQSSGVAAPATTYANMMWYDTGNNLLKMRNETNSAWINVGYVDQTGVVYSVLDDTKVVTSAGTQTGLLGDQTTGTWETGTGTTESLVSPAKVKAAIEALVPAQTPSLGESQSWAVVSRTSGTSYQNTTGRSIQISANLSMYVQSGPDTFYYATVLQVSTNNFTWVEVGRSGAGNGVGPTNSSPVIPPSHWYRYISTLGTTTGVATIAVLS